ncbi:hypothetical protein VM1G_09601 [Cytospora mali]|uniref:Heat shock 70 kDa protein 12B n=1 Tax=Cytospora mali TaxID=578113 RepID=A0A194WBW8_CYTMA|nr:hypothetical protein VM1G_09601 [Valsa mali]
MLPIVGKHKQHYPPSSSWAWVDNANTGQVNDILVVGIDFGTSYSSVAWASASEFSKGQVNIVTVWPEGHGEQWKVPTELCYEEDGINPTWGYQIPADADPVRCLKLLLLKDEDLEEDVRNSEWLVRGRRMMKENGKTAVDLVADYLRALWQHVIGTITRARGSSAVESLSFHVVITVPAIWKGYARQAMKNAARKAGILDWGPEGKTSLSFAPEPEAAALATLTEQGGRIKQGDVYVVCDAGGGTVDLISYKITRAQPISMEEAVMGAGGLCGGIFIDENFELICKKRLGMNWNRLSKAGIKDIMKGEWEYGIKSTIDPGNVNKEYIVKLPPEAFRSQGGGESSRLSSLDDTSREPIIKAGRIHFKKSHIEKAFTDVFSQIEELIDGQVKKAKQQGMTVTGIILVGGLGGSPFLYEHLKSSHKWSGTTVLQVGGMKSRAAICRGAVFKGFVDGLNATEDMPYQLEIEAPIAVMSTIARASYGIKFNDYWDEGVHRVSKKFYDAHEGRWLALDQMKWYMRKASQPLLGDKISKTKAVRHAFSHVLHHEFQVNLIQLFLYQCEDLVAPPHITPNVKRLCTINCNFSVNWSDLPAIRSKKTGELLRRLSFDLEMIPSGASVEFVVYVDGVKQGEQNVQVQFQ